MIRGFTVTLGRPEELADALEGESLVEIKTCLGAKTDLHWGPEGS